MKSWQTYTNNILLRIRPKLPFNSRADRLMCWLINEVFGPYGKLGVKRG